MNKKECLIRIRQVLAEMGTEFTNEELLHDEDWRYLAEILTDKTNSAQNRALNILEISKNKKCSLYEAIQTEYKREVKLKELVNHLTIFKVCCSNLDFFNNLSIRDVVEEIKKEKHKLLVEIQAILEINNLNIPIDFLEHDEYLNGGWCYWHQKIDELYHFVDSHGIFDNFELNQMPKLVEIVSSKTGSSCTNLKTTAFLILIKDAMQKGRIK